MNADEFVRRLLESDEDDSGKLVNKMANRYRRGARLDELLPLLTHIDSRFVSVAAWIVGEVADESRGREIFPQLSRLLEHDDPAVRFEALTSVTQLVRPDEHPVVISILQRLADENAGVRRHALCYVCMMPDSKLSNPSVLAVIPEAVLLLDGVTKEQIGLGIESNELLTRRIAIAGALRNYGDDVAFMAKIEGLCDVEVRAELPNLPRRRSY